MNFYKRNDETWNINDIIVSKHPMIIELIDGNKVHIESLFNHRINYIVPIADIKDKDGAPYGTFDLLMAAVADFFVEATGGSGSSAVTSVNGQTGAVTVTKSLVGLGFVDNTSDASKPVSTAQLAAINAVTTATDTKLANYILITKMAQASGVATLDATGQLVTSQIPSSLLAGLKWKGVWNTTTNTPTLSAAPSANGEFYRVSVAGTSSIPTGSSVSYGVGDWLISNGTAWQHIVNTFNDATTTTKGVVQLAGDLAGGAAAPLVAKVNGITVPATAPTAARKIMMSSSTSALQYDDLTAADLPDATASQKGGVQLAGDLGGTAYVPLVKNINTWAVDNEPTSTSQVLGVTDLANKKLGYVTPLSGGGVLASYMFAYRAEQTTGLSNNAYILFNSISASNSSDVTLNTTTGVFTLKGGKTYHLSGLIPMIQFSSDNAYMAVQWYDITNGINLGREGSMHPFTRAVNEGKTCAFEAIITPVSDIQVAAKFTSIGGIYNVSKLSNSSASIQLLAGTAPITGQTVDTMFARRNTTQGLSAAGDITMTKQSGNLTFNGTYVTLLAGKTYELSASVFGACTDQAGNGVLAFTTTANSPLLGVEAKTANVKYTGGSALSLNGNLTIQYTPTINTGVKLRLTEWAWGTFNIFAATMSVKQLGTSSMTDMSGATSSADGTSGTVPKPIAGKQNSLLKGDGTWSAGLLETSTGYTKLGSDAPAIKMKKITGTTASVQGGQTSLTHGLTASKIIAVNLMIEFNPGEYIGDAHTYIGGYQANFVLYPTTILVSNSTSNSANILSKPFKLLITYEE
jgi:hypothetical protein